MALATAVMTLGIAMIAWFPRWPGQRLPGRPSAAAGVVCTGRAAGLADLAAVPGGAAGAGAASVVQRAVHFGVLYIVTLDAVACYAVAGLFWAVMILLLLLPAVLLGRRLALRDGREWRRSDRIVPPCCRPD